MQAMRCHSQVTFVQSTKLQASHWLTLTRSQTFLVISQSCFQCLFNMFLLDRISVRFSFDPGVIMLLSVNDLTTLSLKNMSVGGWIGTHTHT